MMKLYDSEIYGIRASSPHDWQPYPWVVTYGYDGNIDWPADPFGEREDGEVHVDDPTMEDMIKLADMMIDRWSQLKASLTTK